MTGKHLALQRKRGPGPDLEVVTKQTRGRGGNRDSVADKTTLENDNKSSKIATGAAVIPTLASY